MSTKWYGSINNRIDENKMYCDKIEVGTKMTEYSWSDRKPYEVVEVVDQKHVFVRELDHKYIGNNHMDNNWELISNPDNKIQEMKFRYNKWNFVQKVSPTFDISKMIIINDKLFKAIQKAKETNKEQEIYYQTQVSFGIAE